MEEERRGRLKGDERILGKSAFVNEILRASGEQLHRAYRLRAEGYDLERLAQRVSKIFKMTPAYLWSKGKRKKRLEIGTQRLFQN